MYSSPARRRSRGASSSSRTYRVALPNGRPMVIRCPGEVTWSRLAQIVASVGPYRFHRSTPRSRSWSARATGRASPPQSAVRPGRPFHPASTSMRHVAGVACMTVAPASSRSCASRTGSDASARDATTRWAPVTKGSHSSSAAMSKDRVVTATRTSSGPRPGHAAVAFEEADQAPVRDLHPLGAPGRPRGVDDVCQVVGGGGNGDRRTGAWVVDEEHRGVVRRQGVDQARLGHDHRR